MYYLVHIDNKNMAGHSPEVIVKGFKKCHISMQCMRLMMICCGMVVKRMGMSGMSVSKMNALTENRERDTHW
jgi:hypothetical protein